MTMTKMLGIFVVLVYLSALGIFLYTVMGEGEIPVFENEVKTVQLQQPSQLPPTQVLTEKRHVNATVVPQYKPGVKINDLKAEVNEPEKLVLVSFTVSNINRVAKAFFPPVELKDTKLENDTLSFNITEMMNEYVDEKQLENLRKYLDQQELEATNQELNERLAELQKEQAPPPVISARDYGIRYTYGIIENIETKWHKMRIPSMTVQGIKDLSFNEDEYKADEVKVINQFDITDDLKPGIYTINITIIDKSTFRQVSEITTFEIE